MDTTKTFTDLVQDVFTNLRDIVRSEIRLARVEVKQDATQAMSAAKMFGVGAVLAIFCVVMLLFATAYLLSTWMPVSGAFLTLGVVLGVAALIFYNAGKSQAKHVNAVPERTVETMKENLEWLSNRTK